ncbi:MAG TPA: hypothetical protein VLT62_02800 [Candidatus Methylomirabilis sp.]|nr:hypothetical protein [Candidatus Methylomirabilis sp.]
MEILKGDAAEIPDRSKLTLVVAEPEVEWSGGGALVAQLVEWTRQRGKSPRLYPGALVWCLKKPGRDLREKVELWLAWKRVAREVAEGTLGGEFDKNDRADLLSKVKDAGKAAKDEVWGGYRFAVVADGQAPDGLKVIDLGAGHSSSGETLCGRVVGALKSEALLNESVGAGYIDRNWPPALKAAGAWPLASLRQSFLNGSLTRLLDPDAVLRAKIVEAVAKGDFGLASGDRPDGTYEQVWFKELVSPDEVAFESKVFLLTKAKAQALKAGSVVSPLAGPPAEPQPTPTTPIGPGPSPAPEPTPGTPPPTRTLQIRGQIPLELWNRLGTRILPKLRGGTDVRIGIDLSVTVTKDQAPNLEKDIRQSLDDLGLGGNVRVE